MKKRDKKGKFEREKSKNNYRGLKIYYEAKGYPCIWMFGKNRKVHIDVWERAYGKKPRGKDIHHKDFDKRNYKLSNLELVSGSDHRKIHSGWTEKGIDSEGKEVDISDTQRYKVLGNAVTTKVIKAIALRLL